MSGKTASALFSTTAAKKVLPNLCCDAWQIRIARAATRFLTPLCKNANANLTAINNARHRYTILRPRSAGILLANRLSVHLQAFGTSRSTKTPPEKQKRGAGTGDEGERKTATPFVKSKQMRTFTPATPVLSTLREFKKLYSLDKPGGAGSFPCEGCWYGVAASLPGLIIFTHKATPCNEESHQAPALPGNQRPCRKANHSSPQPSARATHGRRHTTAPSGVSAQNEADCDQNPVFRRAVNPLISFKIINLQRARTL